LPMRVLRSQPGRALVAGRGERREVATALVGDVAPGAWLLVFIDSAREVISAARAAEVDATLDLLQAALGAAPWPTAPAAAPFKLPSTMSAAELAALAGRTLETGS
ncbi:MAG: HypC/HybG/HupF family hydrogenase formation chaperone, partial [Burkholderiales bacterium]|nr:HypC/HybG/HupF family hydrogenase formation chaperone [Burkholderiales bacterium]